MPDERISVAELKSELGDLINDTQDIFTIASDEGIVDFLKQSISMVWILT